jgi:hypothetical protein
LTANFRKRQLPLNISGELSSSFSKPMDAISMPLSRIHETERKPFP